jgi:hypothetical protein
MPSTPLPVYVFPPVGKGVEQLTVPPPSMPELEVDAPELELDAPELEVDEPELEVDEPELDVDPDAPELELAAPELDVDEPEPEPELCPELDADSPASPVSELLVEPGDDEHAARAATNAGGRTRGRICTEILGSFYC